MKVLMATRPGTVEVRDLPIPTIGDYDALCRTQYAGICSGTDTHVIDGSFGPQRFPIVLGHESVGEVVAVGRRVRSFQPGDLVTRTSLPASGDGSFELGWGGMAEYTVARDHQQLAADGYPEQQWQPARVNQVIRSTSLPRHHLPMYITWRETCSYTQRLQVTAGTRVVVSGSGANGLSIAAMSRLLGASDVTIVGSASRRTAAELAGATRVVPYTDSGALEAFVQAHRGRIDLLVDATGIRHSLDPLLPLLAADGIVSVYGLDDIDTYAINPRRASSFRFIDPGYDEAAAHGFIEDAVDAGRLTAQAWIDDSRIFSWGNVAAAYRAARERTLVKPIVNLAETS